VAVIALVYASRGRHSESAEFVGAQACASCHSTQASAWKTSQHAQAMQLANDSTVLGKFDSTRFTSEDVSALFFRRGDKYFVETGGEDGIVHEY
jgi:hypothetical protein